MKFLIKFFGGVVLTLSAQWACAACATWGCASVTQLGITMTNLYIKGTSDDTKEDGYCVYIRYRRSGESWPAHNGGRETKSCGPKVSFVVDSGSTLGAAGIRLYREDGRYLTLYGS
ncbi:MAG: hypothetical protein EOO68_01905 [Moraxellaceae bacterium]|jgi:hypothetical protein|nr:MAG: hypothetical protein EOO68_01905 [Moraxellaceae bacterium]